APLQMPVLDGGDAGRVVAAILEPLQRIDEVLGDRLLPQYADDAAHVSGPRLRAGLHPMAADGCNAHVDALRCARRSRRRSPVLVTRIRPKPSIQTLCPLFARVIGRRLRSV